MSTDVSESPWWAKLATMVGELRSDYHRGLEAINRLLTQMIASVEDAISAASTAVLSSDDEAAEHVVLRGQIIEDLHQSVEALVFTQLARQAPVGGDLSVSGRRAPHRA